MTEPTGAFEKGVRDIARSMPYPETPDLSGHWHRRRPAQRALVWAVGVALLLVFVLLAAVPSARATVGEMIRLGVVRILMGAETPSATPDVSRGGNVTAVATQSDVPVGAIDFAGETTLEEAAAALPFVVRLPTHPADLGPPDRVFLQGQPPAGVALVWTDPKGEARLALFELAQGLLVSKFDPQTVTMTEVEGVTAYWTSGPYTVEVKGKGVEVRRLIEGHVLIWRQGPMTYRLETDLELREAVRVAESLE